MPSFAGRLKKGAVSPNSFLGNALGISLTPQAIARKEHTAMKAIDVIACSISVCMTKKTMQYHYFPRKTRNWFRKRCKLRCNWRENTGKP